VLANVLNSTATRVERRAMTLGAVKAGDLVLADRKGRRFFFSVVTAPRERELEVEPVDRRVTCHVVKACEVIGIWHKRRQRTARCANTQWPRRERPPHGQLRSQPS
jgi:hypothetical protein